MRVLAAYGLDDTPKLSRERTFVKSIFLLQIVQYNDLDAPKDTIVYDLEISNVRPQCGLSNLFPSLYQPQTPHFTPNIPYFP